MFDDKMSNYTSTVLYGSLKSEKKINKSQNLKNTKCLKLVRYAKIKFVLVLSD